MKKTHIMLFVSGLTINLAVPASTGALLGNCTTHGVKLSSYDYNGHSYACYYKPPAGGWQINDAADCGSIGTQRTPTGSEIQTVCKMAKDDCNSNAVKGAETAKWTPMGICS